MIKRVGIGFVIVLAIGLHAFQLWEIRGLKSQIDDALWDSAVQGKNDDSTIEPQVGTIQFLKKGYSIQLEGVKYTGDGILLSGFIGNPLNLTISNLTLKFTATKQLYEYRDDFRKERYTLLFGPQSIGEGQTTPINSLVPGSKAPFDVTIPNVKQTKEGVRIVVTFTGERYSY